MCNRTALPPHRPAAQRHKCGTTTVLRRFRTAKAAPPQRTKVSKIRNLCAPNCGIFSDAGTIWPRWPLFSAYSPCKPGRLTWKTYEYALLGWCTLFPVPKLHLVLPFSPPGPAWPPFPFPKESVGDYSRVDQAWTTTPEKSSSWAARVPTPVWPPAAPSR